LVSKNDDASITPDLVTFNSLINGWANAGVPGKAEDYLSAMEVARIEASAYSYITLMDAWVKSKNPWKVNKLLQKLQNVGLSSVASFNSAI